MNRIYQGRGTRVEILTGKKAEPQSLDGWQEKLWRHHELFQDVVNHYTLALAAMAEGVNGDTAPGAAVLAWRAQVRETGAMAAARRCVTKVRTHGLPRGSVWTPILRTNTPPSTPPPAPFSTPTAQHPFSAPPCSSCSKQRPKRI